jgi:Na+/alanine symporter
LTQALANQKGQQVTEAVLIMVVLMAFTLMVGRYFRQNEVLKQLITGPWVAMSGMLQNGVWLSPEKGALSHPNGHTRHITIQGESAR